MKVHYSSKKMDYGTPLWFYNRLHRRYDFVFDLASDGHNNLCPDYYTPQDDALVQDWTKLNGSLWLNPPYGRAIGIWLEKAYMSTQACEDITIVCLVPARTDTRWWWANCIHGEIYFVKGRLSFNGMVASAPFPSAVVVFRKTVDGRTDYPKMEALSR